MGRVVVDGSSEEPRYPSYPPDSILHESNAVELAPLLGAALAEV